MADVSIDGSISTSTARAPRSLVFVTSSIGYQFYIDSDGTFGYSKTTDGGATWGAQVEIAAATTHVGFDVWYDQWTPGDAGTVIHTWYFDTTNDAIRWRSLTTNGDTLGTERTVISLTSAVAANNSYVTGTKTRSGYLYCMSAIDSSNEEYFGRSTDGGTTWSASLDAGFQESNPDHGLLFPASGTGDDNDCWCVYHDSSVPALTMKMWDSSAAAQVESSTVQTNIAVGTDLTVYQYPYSGAIRHSDGALILVSMSDRDTATTDMQVWEVTAVNAGSLTGITAKTNITTDKDDNYHPQVFIDQGNNDIYVAYNGKRDGTETLGTTTKVYYTKSTDGAATWSAGDTAYMEGAAGVVVQVWTPLSGPLFHASWRVGTTLLGNKVNSVDATKRLYLRNTTDNAIGAGYYDLSTTAGSSSDTAVVNTATAPGSPIQWTKTAGGQAIKFATPPLSRAVTAQGLAAIASSTWVKESNNAADAKLYFDFYKRDGAGTETSLFSFDSGEEFTTSDVEKTYSMTPLTNTLAVGDRIVVKVSIKDVGAMVSGHTATLTFNAADASTGDSFFRPALMLAFASNTQALAGSGTVTLTPTGTAGAVADLVGTSTLTFTPTATLPATGALLGASALSFAPVALLAGTAPLAGASTVLFAPTGATTADVSISASATMLFAPVAAITGAVELVGSGTLSFSPTATAAGAGALAGAPTLSFSSAATMDGPGALAGSGIITFSPSAVLAGAGDLLGTSALVFVPAAGLAGDAPVAGAATLTFAAIGNMVVFGDLAGGGSLSFAPVAAMDGPGALLGASTLSFAPSASADAAGALLGASAIAFSPLASASGTGALIGSSTLSFVPVGIVDSAGELVGEAALVFTASGVLLGVAFVVDTSNMWAVPHRTATVILAPRPAMWAA